MTHSDKLKALIEKAIDGGWKPEVDPTNANWDEPGNEQLLPSIIFNHDFAKALFGEEKSWMEDSHLTFKAYEIQLMDAVTSEDPITHMYDAVFGEDREK